MRNDNVLAARHFLLMILGVVFLILFGVSFIRITHSGVSLSFASFLEFISNTPTIVNPGTIYDFQITGDWSVFNGLRDVINMLGGFFGVMVWFARNVINGIGYIFYYISFIFAF